jgi:hypothetical protein
LVSFSQFADLVVARSSQELERAEAFVWFNALNDSHRSMTVSEIAECFVEARLARPNTSRLRDRLIKSPHALRAKGNGSFMSSREGDSLFSKKYPEILTPSANAILTPLSKTLRDHIAKFQSETTQEFLDEAASCMEHGHYRAAVVLSWVGAVSVMQEFVLKNKLDDFNRDAVANKVLRAPARSIEDMRDISKESQFLESLCRISMVDGATKKQLKECLDRRNNCGHPTEIRFGEAYVANHIEILVHNVFARFA